MQARSLHNSTISKLLDQLEGTQEAVDRAELLFQLGKAYNLHGDFEKALDMYTTCAAIFKRLGDTKRELKAEEQGAYMLGNQGKLNEAGDKFKALLQRCIAEDETTEACSCYVGLGNVYGQQGKAVEALRCYELALEIARKGQQQQAIATLLTNMGVLLLKQGDYPGALKNYLEALRFWKQLNHPGFMQMTYLNIGVVYQSLGRFQDSLDSYRQALELHEQSSNVSVLAQALLGMGDVNYRTENFSEALGNYKEALQTKTEIGDRQGMAHAYNRMGLIANELGSLQEALDYFKRAEKIFIETDVKGGLAEVYRHMGMAHKKADDYKAATDCIQRALNIALQSDSKGVAATLYEDLYGIHKAVGDYAAALAHFEKHVALQNEVRSVEADRQIADLKTGYDLELKEKERQLLEEILHNILPASIADRIKNGEEKIIQRFESASVLFADMVGFTAWSEQHNTDEVAETLSAIFSLFDELANEHGVEKIKTIGDAYMCVAGLPEPCADHAERLANMALGMRKRIKEAYPGGEIKLRIGIHAGEVVAGVLGKNKYAYDLWGDTVNTASRMESHGLPDKIQVSDEFKRKLNGAFSFEAREEMDVKGKGRMKNWFISEPL